MRWFGKTRDAACYRENLWESAQNRANEERCVLSQTADLLTRNDARFFGAFHAAKRFGRWRKRASKRIAKVPNTPIDKKRKRSQKTLRNCCAVSARRTAHRTAKQRGS
jgi:hypothetical protein